MPGFHPLSLCTTPVELFFNETNLGVASGFFYREAEQHYLVTNWHVLTGRHPRTGKHLSAHAGEPNRLRIWHHRAEKAGNRQLGFLPLVINGAPLWLQHRSYGSRVDVAALPLPHDERFNMFPINDVENPPPEGTGPCVGRDVFVLGYPLSKLTMMLTPFPIWKRASIATELDILIEDVPEFLVDTATREGMSGSPVVFVMGRFLQFMGVYSGRYGADDLESVQLGTVWRASVVREIVADGVPGTTEPSLPAGSAAA